MLLLHVLQGGQEAALQLPAVAALPIQAIRALRLLPMHVWGVPGGSQGFQ